MRKNLVQKKPVHRRMRALALAAWCGLAANVLAGADNDAPDPWRALHTVTRQIPAPLPDHPGNIFLENEDVRITVPRNVPEAATRWRAVDDDGTTIAAGSYEKDKTAVLDLGQPGIGWYRIEFLDAAGEVLHWTTAAVLGSLTEPVPQDSPVCLDSATAWFAHGDPMRQRTFANLAALAGVNWIRDRLRWREMQPAPDELMSTGTYDTAAAIQSEAGLKVLEVFHDTPPWAVEDDYGRGQFPRDLRVAYRFGSEMAKRFRGEVQAWEPWNEANISNFGSHTVDEMCSYQKAAYLGFKAGATDITVGWNAQAAIPTTRTTIGVLANETWPYYDTYNIHTYDWAHDYRRLWAPAREAACGRPLWLTEADRGIDYATGPPWHDLTPRHERLKAEYMAQEYASSFAAGCNRHFHFILGHYTESGNRVQFGLLRQDMTPRPAYVALAALGRLLAGARCLGRMESTDDPNVWVVAFRGRPGGREGDVLVAWAETRTDWAGRGNYTADWTPPADLEVRAVYDYLGRPIGNALPPQLKSAAVFIVLEPGEADKLPLDTVARSEYRTGQPTPVVLQAQMPFAARRKVEDVRWSGGYMYTAPDGEEIEVPIAVHNFGQRPVSGSLQIEKIPAGIRIEAFRFDVELEPAERTFVTIKAAVTKTDPTPEDWIVVRGDFGAAGRPVVAFQIAAEEQ